MKKREKIFEFYVFDILLKKSMSSINAAEAHGIILAFLCMKNIDHKYIEYFVSNILDIKQNKKIVFHFVQKILYYNLNQIKDFNKMLSVMVPNKKESTLVKMKYLKFWLQGFISGLGLFGLNLKKYNIPILYEILNDFSLITYFESSGSEYEEYYYISLMEYVKVSVEIIYFEIYKTKN